MRTERREGGRDEGRVGATALRVLAAIGWRYACFALMTAAALFAEQRPAPRLPDLVLEHVPYVPWVDRWNYVIWLGAWLPLALVLLARDVERFVRYMIAGGVVSLLRGATIAVTGLGPVRGADVNAGLGFDRLLHAWFEILDPFGVFVRDAAHIYLTKDLFFSGHTASTFLLLLYVWPWRGLRWTAAVLHIVVVASVLLSHLHYTIDVLGAYAFAFSVFVLLEQPPREALRGGRGA